MNVAAQMSQANEYWLKDFRRGLATFNWLQARRASKNRISIAVKRNATFQMRPLCFT